MMAASPAGSARSGGQALVDEIATEIRTRILDGRIEVGAWLRQETLAGELGVSRTPVREALRQLQAAGLVEALPRRGALVRGMSPRDIREAYVVRAELEGLAAELAAELITDEQLVRLRDAEDLFRVAVAESVAARAARGSRWPRANDLFHDVILEASGNRRLADTVGQLHQSFPRNLTWAALSSSSRLLSQNVDEHARIRDCIEAHDGPGARAAMKDHVRRAGELIAHRAETHDHPAGVRA
jgi:DNA-binding GntR family transcriptional regulator